MMEHLMQTLLLNFWYENRITVQILAHFSYCFLQEWSNSSGSYLDGLFVEYICNATTIG